MKTTVLFILCALLVAGILTVLVIIHSHKTVLRNAILSLPEGFTYTAHTGCMDTKDNSLEAIEAGVKHGAGIVEFDLRFLPDGTPVLSHDRPKGTEPTLDEAFKKVSEYPHIKVNVDVKETKNLGAVYPLAQKYGIEDRIFYTGIDLSFVDAARKDSPQVSYYLNYSIKKPKQQTPEYLQELVNIVKSAGAVGININKGNATKELVDVFRQNGLLVSIWTVNKETDMYKILRLSPDNITTRNPQKLGEILNSNDSN